MSCDLFLFAGEKSGDLHEGLLYHYICPSVWAWGKKRIPLMKKNLDKLFTILPFETTYFPKEKGDLLEIAYVGNPLVQRVQEHIYHPGVKLQQGLASGKKIIALFPGSRKKEIERNLPLQLRVCAMLAQKDPDLLFALSISDEKYRPLIEKECSLFQIPHLLIGADQTYELMKSSFAAIAKSGTVTLELALHLVPTVVTYAISYLDFIIAYHILRIRLPYYCLVNILGSQEIFPELFGPRFTEKSLLEKASDLIYSTEKRKACQTLCLHLKDMLGDKKTGPEVAEQILSKI
ncbi:MAG: hypothetical protein HYZ48_00105 [Chlamydiales bacterium]|nr:hypothetical protein [Chlamydiales bacterium]